MQTVNNKQARNSRKFLAYFIFKCERPHKCGLKGGWGGFSLNEDYSTFAIGEYFSGTVIVLTSINLFMHLFSYLKFPLLYSSITLSKKCAFLESTILFIAISICMFSSSSRNSSS